MTAVVWKYPIDFGDTTFDVPIRAKFISTAMQGEKPVVWALVDPEERDVKQVVTSVVATGENRGSLIEGKFLGTLEIKGTFLGDLYFHVFIRD